MAKDTKDRILSKALELFSQKGYDGTNIKEIMMSLGLVKTAMYRHFESKEEIWNTLLDRLIEYYEERFGSSEHLPPVPESLEELFEMTMRMVNFTVHDETVVMTRKLLTIEQFRDDRARALATKHFLNGLTEMFTHVFSGMMDRELLRRDDPAMVAFAYTAPISALIHLCDREPEKKDDALARIEAFCHHFIKVYGM
jgi:AcrR family transcriptional regulator